MPRPRAIEDAELLDRLLDAFADLGYEGTSLREICRHLEISHNLIHRRYQSKEAAWRAAVDHGFKELFEALLMPIDELPDDELDRLRQYMLSYAAVIVKRPALARIIQQESARPGPRFDYMFSRYIGPARKESAAQLDSLQRAGRVRDGAVETVYFFLTTWGIGGLGSAPSEIRGTNGHGPSGMALAELAVDVVIDGLRARRTS